MQRMVLTTLWGLLLFSWICGSKGQDGEPCSGFLEIGEPTSLSCSSNHLTDGITMQMKVNNGFVNVSSCKLSGRQCTDNMAPVYTTTFFGIRENDGEKQNAMLVYINSTSKNESTFRCVYDGRPTNTACFEMFGTPAKPECDPPTLVNSDTQLNITCTSDRVYPDAYMSILALHGDQVYLPDDYEAEFHTTLSPSMTHAGYNITTTQTLVDLSTLEPDTYQFLISMHPLISNITMAGRIMSEHTQIKNVVLTAPVAILSSDCPVDSYIMAGNCTCNLTTPGYPPGQARWYTQTGQVHVVGSENSEDRTSTLSFSQQSAASYACRAETVLNVTSASTVSFTPKFPYGPHSVIIESSVVDGIFDLCPSEEYKTVMVTCKVPTEDVEPGVTLAILVNNDIPVDEQNGENTDSHNIYHYSFRPSKGGSYSVECRAQNTVSLQQSYSEKLTFEVREPPPLPPVLHIPPNQPGSKEANIVLGRTLDITCKVDGGYRKVSEVTITCGSKQQQVQSNIATLTVEDVTQSMDGQMCYCSATHDSGCYEKESEVLLKMVSADGPIPVIIESSVVDGIFDLCPSEEYKTVEVTCKVPAEDVERGVTLAILVNNDIPVDLDEQTGGKTDSHNIYHYSFRPSKGGSYSVKCRAQNTVSVQQSYSEKLTFEVREPPTSPPVFHIPPNQPGSAVANIVLGRTIDITCKVDGGYGQSNKVTITCGSRKQQVQSNIATLTVAKVTQSMDGQMCYCSATHDSGCYDKESKVLLKVVSEDTEDSKNQSSDTKLILVIALPVTCGVVVLALVVVNIMICTKKRKRNPVPPKNNDTGLQPMQRNALQGVYVPQRPQASSDYARVMRSDDVTSNRDWGHTNPRFTASHQYDRMSTGFGSTRTSDFF